MGTVTTIFLDRDGVINDKRPDGDYVLSWAEFRFRPGAIAALRLLSEMGRRLIIVTNQRAVARDLLSVEGLNRIHARMLTRLEQEGVRCAAIYVCPHEIGECSCRKPGVELFMKAQAEFPGLDFHESIVIGDSLSDMDCGTRLGSQTFLVVPKRRRGELLAKARASNIRVDGAGGSLWEVAVCYLLGDRRAGAGSDRSASPPSGQAHGQLAKLP